MLKVKDSEKINAEETKKDKVIYFFAIILFVSICLFVGSFHEPWSDEAQSWLIAREQSVKDIFFYNSRYEGTFPLWLLTLKVFISLGGTYEYIYVVSTIISTIGILILLYKTKVTKQIKCLIPFSFYVLYQYTVVARSYCYLLLAFAILLSIYEKRHEKIIQYILNLVLFSMISLHGMLVSGILALFYFIESIKEFKEKRKIDKKKVIGMVFLILIYCFEIYILIPPKDLLVDMNYRENIFIVILNIIFRIVASGENIFSTLISSMIIGIWVVIIEQNRKKKKRDFLLIVITTIVLFLFIRAASHHLGILFLILLTRSLITNDEKNIKPITVCLSLYAILTIITVSQEINLNYSGSKEMAQYISSIEDYKNKEIYGIGYKSVAILPYFEKNIYNNREECYYLWSTQNSEWVLYSHNAYTDLDVFKFDDGKMIEYILLEYHDLNDIDINIKKVIETSELYELVYETE